MVKRITSGKRDREKLKQEKREEKQKRKEERLNSGTRSFEEMLAYVDENGVIHSTPQDLPRQEVDASEILVSVPKQSEIEIDVDLTHNGRVDFFNAAKGFGFIIDKVDNEKYFFHISNAPTAIAEGDKVTFEIERGMRGMNAVKISIVNE